LALPGRRERAVLVERGRVRERADVLGLRARDEVAHGDLDLLAALRVGDLVHGDEQRVLSWSPMTNESSTAGCSSAKR